ncbi:MAG: type II toxin-antitoxin system HigB family toxin [Candidatus Thermoplasmatota archaeon]|nr:type II toxin-antitoxin system HigB family toxin [Candidatus Thermoplasmatota archaeon]
MRIISKPILKDFWTKHPDAEKPLQVWYKTIKSRDFLDLKDLKYTFKTADRVDGLTVFNIGGNKYRLIASIHYNRKKVFIRSVLTHPEYDRGNWKQQT